jgi:hypothetical protein
MMVNGPLQIYGIVIGFKIFDDLFNILASMGIIYLPLLVIFFENITKPYQSEIENGASTSIRTVGMHLVIWIFVVMAFVVPTHTLDVTGITYMPPCTGINGVSLAQPSKLGDTGTTYDQAFENLNYSSIHIPIMMGFVLSAMSGLTNASIVSLPCKTDVQAIQNTIDTTRLTPVLQNQVQRFENECFAPARAKFDSHTPDQSSYESTMNDYGGQTDLSWMGSHVFQQLYYADLYPSEPVPGFPYGEYPSQYQQYNDKSNIPHPQWGYPSCQDWWSDGSLGLEAQLVQLAENHHPQNSHLGTVSITTQLSSWLADAKTITKLGSQVTPEDVISHDMLTDVGSNAGFGQGFTGPLHVDNATDDSNDSLMDPMGNAVQGALTNGASFVGQGMAATDSAFDRAEIDQEIPIFQAVLLALSLALGPLIILLGMTTGRGISVIFTYYFLVGSLLFITFVEALIHYLEISLHASQSYSMYALGNSVVMYNIFTKLYFWGPMIYFGLMSVAGISIGGALQTSFSNGNVTGKGAAAFKETAGAAVSAITKL